jgi:sporulation protein YabP
MEKNIAEEHSLSMLNREAMSLSGVKEVSEFSDSRVVLKTIMGDLTVKGKKLTINQLNTDTGTLDVRGEIDTIHYTGSGNGFFAGLLG